jgi:Ca2+-binding RTX toxin-like protein
MVATYTGRADSDDIFTGTAEADLFLFAADDLTSGDVVVGGPGGPGILDTLHITTGGVVTAEDISGVRSIEQVLLSDAGVSITIPATLFSDAYVSYPNDSRRLLTIKGGAGADVIDCSAVSQVVDLTSGGGDDRLIGGRSESRFRFDAADLTARDVVIGGAAKDTLYVTGSGAVDLARVSGMDAISFDGAIQAALVAGNFPPGIVGAVYAGAGSRIDGSAASEPLRMGGYSCELIGSAGDDVLSGGGSITLRGGAGDDDFLYQDGGQKTPSFGPEDVIDGGAGKDVLRLDNYFARGRPELTFDNVTGVEQIFVIGVHDIDYYPASGTGTRRFIVNDATVASTETGRLNIYLRFSDGFVDASELTKGHSITIETYNSTEAAGSRGGAGNDVFKTSYQVHGGAGIDQLITSSVRDLDKTSGIERFTVDNFTGVFDNSYFRGLDRTTVEIVLRGGAVINAEAVGGAYALDISCGAGSDVLIGGAGRDMFRYNGANLNAVDIVRGGAGIDTLVLAGASAPDLGGVSGIERIVLTAAPGLVLEDGNLAGTTAGRIIVTGSDGNDTIDASALTGDNAITAVAGGGADRLLGGDGADLFTFHVASLDAEDWIVGGSGVDTLQLLGSARAVDLSRVKGVDAIELTGAGNRLVVDDGLVARTDRDHLTVFGNTGADTINAATLAAHHRVTVASGGGDDTLLGGAGRDRFLFNVQDLDGADVVRGGDGVDTLKLVDGGGVASLTGVVEVERILLSDAGNTLLLGNGSVFTAGRIIGVTGGAGADRIDGSALNRGNALTAGGRSGEDMITGGAGADVIAGGLGNDLLTGGDGADSFLWRVREDALDRVMDFAVDDGDRLLFKPRPFDVSGVFDTRVIAGSTADDITEADLIVFTGGALDDAADVVAYLQLANGGAAGEGVFVAGTTSAGTTVLFHALDASTGAGMIMVADLGSNVDAVDLTPAQFGLI